MNNKTVNILPFKLYLIRKGLRSTTVKQYTDFVSNYLSCNTLSEVESYIMSLIAANKKHTYINSVITSLRQYGNFINNKKLKAVKFLKVQERSKGILHDKEIEEFLALKPTPTHDKTQYYKMRLFWMCLVYSGARTSEIAGLTVNTVDFGRNVFIVTGKMGERIIPINPILIQPLQDHIKTLHGDLLFPAVKTNRAIERATWNKDFHKRIDRLGIKRDNITPYSLRHSFITRLLDTEGVNVFNVQQVVGHKRLITTQGYYHQTHKQAVNTVRRDPLSRTSQNYTERFYSVREGLRRLLNDFALNLEEEKQMLEDLGLVK